MAKSERTPSSEQIPVHISYEIIRLFSEGLYQSPQKAVEELVSNSYDAGASEVRIVLPEPGDDDDDELEPLWVVDDGHGMDGPGFHDLWRVADSQKSGAEAGSRPPIGQFGIGKLAAYVLAHRLMHVSCVGGEIRSTVMNFRDLEGRHQFEDNEPFNLTLTLQSEAAAKELLADIEHRDPASWAMLFGEERRESWTVAGMSDFKSLYDKLSAGRLRWVLETGLPLHSSFAIFVDGEKLESSKLNFNEIATFSVGANDDPVAEALDARDGHSVKANDGAIYIPGISGPITGNAVIYERRLTEGKSDRYDRSHGFFIRVRGRVINLEDELFGLGALNHAAWARFSMEVEADGLRDHLLSSREGVRESQAIDTLREYLRGVFNHCRRKYDEWFEKQQEGLDLDSLLKDAPSLFVTEPMIAGVQRVLATRSESFYVDSPDLEGEDQAEWLHRFEQEAAELPIAKVLYEATGINDRVLHFLPESRTLIMNTNHPFVEKLLSGGRTNAAATLFGSTELLLDLLLQDHGLPTQAVIDLLADRDRALRLMAGSHPSTAEEVLRLLRVANRNDRALERAIGAAFNSLGFEYERRGGAEGGTDGVLFARLGKSDSRLEDFKVVYDAKQTSSTAVSAAKVKVASLEDFREEEDADFGFFVADAYSAQNNKTGKLNKEIRKAVKDGVPVTLLTIDHLRRLVEAHYQHGVTLTDVRRMLTQCHHTYEVDDWISNFVTERATDPPVPLHRVLSGIERAKDDRLASPNIHAVRATDQTLQRFEPDRLIANLSAVETLIGKRWIEVGRASGDIRLHHTADQIVAEVERLLRELLGVNAVTPQPTA